MIPGYAHGLRSPGAATVLELAGAASWSRFATGFCSLLKKHLSVESESEVADTVVLAVGTRKKPGRAQASAVPMLVGLARVIRALQRAAGLPDLGGCFASVEPDPASRMAGDQWLLAVPSLSPRAAAEALSWTTRIAGVFIRNPAVDALTAAQLADMRRVIERMSAQAPRGTNNRCFLGAARELEIPTLQLTGGVFQYGWSRRSRWLDSSFTEDTSRISTMLARNKAATAALLRQAGLPVPDHRPVRTFEAALEVARTLGYPVVVKPLSEDGGVGVSAGLGTESELRVAFDRARAHSQDLLVEKHIEGRDYRVYVFRGRTVWAMERIPAGVTGDGIRSVRALVAEANRDPRRGKEEWSPMSPIELDAEAHELLESAGLGLDAVPEAGRFVRLRRAANVSSGGLPVGVFDRIHPDNARLCERAASVLRLDLAGVDLLMPDISRSWRETGAGICEVNAQPQLSGATAPHMYAQILREIVPGKGRVPVVLVLTDGRGPDYVKLAADALARRRLCVGATSAAGLTIADQRIRAGRESPFADVRTLMIDSTVEAMVIGVDGLQFLQTGLPVDRIDLLVLADWAPASLGKGSHRREASLGAVLSLMEPYCGGEVMVARQHWGASAAVKAMGHRLVRLLDSPDEIERALAAWVARR